MKYRVRAERPCDAPAIHALLSTAFPTDQEANLVDRLRDNQRLIVSLVAEVEHRLIGHAAFSPVTIDHKAGIVTGAGLAPVAVDSSWRRRGIAARLITEGLSVCENNRVDFVVVLGEPHYYRRFGFEKASLRGVANVYGVDEPFMLIELRRDSVQPGVAHYAPEFAALSEEN